MLLFAPLSRDWVLTTDEGKRGSVFKGLWFSDCCQGEGGQKRSTVKEGHLRHWFSESVNDYLLVLLPEIHWVYPLGSISLAAIFICPEGHYFSPCLSGLSVFTGGSSRSPFSILQPERVFHSFFCLFFFIVLLFIYLF